ncbi:MAG: hypothetical protein A2X94_14915 [Bdellovibrionales bacterium GWB1_55_8]|nr:MAG: hypothetical protein A2X94_14915 [Bdellovibrionales bacterium GWB1_55_8]
MSVIFSVLCSFTAPVFASSSSWHGRILRADDETSMTFEQLTSALSTAEIVVLGEKHYTPALQAAQGEIIKAVVREQRREGNFTTAWEFLNASSQEETKHLFSLVVSGKITAVQFLEMTQGADSSSYAPVIEATKELGGDFIGVNLSRQEKSPVSRGGIGAADPKLIPPGFAYGSPGYHERFVDIMSAHVPPEKMQNYYDAQCLTDDVMAYQLIQSSTKPLRFLVVGSFHSDYFDGTVGRITARAPGQRTVTIRLIDASDYTQAELQEGFRDPKYGALADYLYFVNEPSEAPRLSRSMSQNVQDFLGIR